MRRTTHSCPRAAHLYGCAPATTESRCLTAALPSLRFWWEKTTESQTLSQDISERLFKLFELHDEDGSGQHSLEDWNSILTALCGTLSGTPRALTPGHTLSRVRKPGPLSG